MPDARALLLSAAVTSFATAQDRTDLADLSDEARDALITELVAEPVQPSAYLARCARDHDVVILGEIHQHRPTCELVADAVPALYAAGVRCVATEFLRHSLQGRIDAVIAGEDYDHDAVVQLFREGPWPTWGFAEYMDIVRAVWRHNRTLDEGAEPMRLLGIDSDWSQHELWFGGLSRNERFAVMLTREKVMVRSVLDGPIADGDKVLVHVGYAHSVTIQGERLGAVLRRELGDRVFQVAVHHEIPNGKREPSAFTGLMDDVFTAAGRPLGFSIRGTPLADLDDRHGMVALRARRPELDAIAMGYVIFGRADARQPVSWVPGFVTEETFPAASDVAIRLGWVEEGACSDAAALDRALAARFPK